MDIDKTELISNTKKTIDNLLIDPRKVERNIDIPIELSEKDDSIVSQITDFVKDYSNGQVVVTPTFSIDNKRCFGIKFNIKF